MIEDRWPALGYIAWRIRLWLVSVNEHAHERAVMLGQRAYNAFVRHTRVQRVLDRIDPFDHITGYRHGRIRRFASRLVTPRLSLTGWLWHVIERIAGRFAPYVGPGKFEGNARPDRLKVEWLYEHSEYADEQGGDMSEFGLHFDGYYDLDVPWSRTPESWVLWEDNIGFVTGTQYRIADLARTAFDQQLREYDAFVERDLAGDREGEPEFNGAW